MSDKPAGTMQLQISMDDETAQGTYVNMATVTHTDQNPFGYRLLMWLRSPWRPAAHRWRRGRCRHRDIPSR